MSDVEEHLDERPRPKHVIRKASMLPPDAPLPRDPVTGEVLTKRAFRRRMVKKWERSQKQQREETAEAAHATLKAVQTALSPTVTAVGWSAGGGGSASGSGGSGTTMPLGLDIIASNGFRAMLPLDGGGGGGGVSPPVYHYSPFEFLYRRKAPRLGGEEGGDEGEGIVNAATHIYGETNGGKGPMGSGSEDQYSGSDLPFLSSHDSSDDAKVVGSRRWKGGVRLHQSADATSASVPPMATSSTTSSVPTLHTSCRVDRSVFEDIVRRRSLIVAAPTAGAGRKDDHSQHELEAKRSVASLPLQRLEDVLASEKVPQFPSVTASRVGGLDRIPWHPLAPGTDINQPTPSYLQLDPVHGVHKSAPGFRRNHDLATAGLIQSAANCDRSVDVITDGSTMRTLFQSILEEKAPLTLRVQRVGKTILLQGPEVEPDSVEGARQKALLAKALYRLADESSAPSSSASTPASPLYLTDKVSESTVPIPPPSSVSGALVPARQNNTTLRHSVTGVDPVHAYNSTLHWGLSSLDVLVGLDTPIVVDRQSLHSEHAREAVFALQDLSAAGGGGSSSRCLPLLSSSAASPPALVTAGVSSSSSSSPVVLSPDSSSSHHHVIGASLADLHRDALRLWFDATLANVSQVGICVHNRGVVQSYQRKNVGELLSMVDGKVAATALTFTEDVLQWLYTNCSEDGNYAVIRNQERNTLELYRMSASSAPHRRTSTGTVEEVDDDDDEVHHSEDPHRAASASRRLADEKQTRLTTAESFFRLGFTHEQRKQPFQALSLWCSAFELFVEQLDDTRAQEAVSLILQKIVQLTSDCIAQRMGGCATGPGVCPSSEEGLDGASLCSLSAASSKSSREQQGRGSGDGVISSGREVPDVLRDVLTKLTGMEGSVRAALLRSFSCLPATAVVFLQSAMVVLADAAVVVMARCLDQCCKARSAFLSVRRTVQRKYRRHTSVLRILAATYGELLQVFLEGLLVLERVLAIASVEAVSAAPTAEEGTRNDAALLDSKRPARAETKELHAKVNELVGDLYLSIVADHTPTTHEAVTAIAKHILQREASRGAAQSTHNLKSFAALSKDIAGIGFAALRHYQKAALPPTDRLLRKVSQVHYFVGLFHARTERFTKARDSLAIAESMRCAASAPTPQRLNHHEEEEEVPLTSSVLCYVDNTAVRSALGLVELRLAMSRRRAYGAQEGLMESASSPLTVASLLTVQRRVGVVVRILWGDREIPALLREDEEQQYRRALDTCTRNYDATLAQRKSYCTSSVPSYLQSSWREVSEVYIATLSFVAMRLAEDVALALFAGRGGEVHEVTAKESQRILEAHTLSHRAAQAIQLLEDTLPLADCNSAIRCVALWSQTIIGVIVCGWHSHWEAFLSNSGAPDGESLANLLRDSPALVQKTTGLLSANMFVRVGTTSQPPMQSASSFLSPSDEFSCVFLCPAAYWVSSLDVRRVELAAAVASLRELEVGERPDVAAVVLLRALHRVLTTTTTTGGGGGGGGGGGEGPTILYVREVTCMLLNAIRAAMRNTPPTTSDGDIEGVLGSQERWKAARASVTRLVAENVAEGVLYATLKSSIQNILDG